MGTLREKLGLDEDQRSLLRTMPEDQTVRASALQQKDMERHRCQATRVPTCASCSIPTDCLAVGANEVSDIDGPTTAFKAAVAGATNRDREIEAEEDDASCSEDSHNLPQVDPGAVSRSNIRSKPVTLQNKGIEATEIEPKKSAVEMKADGGSRLKLPRKRTIDLTDSGDASEEGVSGSAGVNLKRNQIVPLGAEPPPGKRTKRVSHLPKSVDDTKHGKQPKLKLASVVSSLHCQGKKQNVKESYNNSRNGETTSHERLNNRRKNIVVSAKANDNVSMGDFAECSQSKSKRKRQVGEAVSLADVSQRRGCSVPCATCRSDTRTRRGTSRNSRVTLPKSHVDAASRPTPQRKKKQKAPERDFRVENDTGTTHVSETESQQGWAVIRDALRSQTEWADTSLHDAVDSNGLRESSKRKTDKHSDDARSSRWERRIRPRRTNCLEPGAFLTPRLLTRPDSTYLDVVAGETVLVNHIDHDPCRWEAADEVELVACQDGNTPHGYRDGSGRICRLYRQYLDIVNGEVLRQVACELWEYVS